MSLKPTFLLLVLPHITPFEFENELNTGDNVQLNCHVSKGDTPLNITWTLNGKPIGPSSGITTLPIGTRTNLLNINSVDREHSGTYTCTASNKGGQAAHSATLFINGTPSLLSWLISSLHPLICHYGPQFFPISYHLILRVRPTLGIVHNLIAT